MYDIQAEIHPHKYKQHEHHEYGKEREFIDQRFLLFLVCVNIFERYIELFSSLRFESSAL